MSVFYVPRYQSLTAVKSDYVDFGKKTDSHGGTRIDRCLDSSDTNWTRFPSCWSTEDIVGFGTGNWIKNLDSIVDVVIHTDWPANFGVAERSLKAYQLQNIIQL